MVLLVPNAEISDELVCFLNRKHSEVLLAKEIIHDGAVSPQKVESHRMVQLNSLAHIDHVDEVIVPQKIVLAQVSMHQFSLLEHPPNSKQGLFVRVLPIFNRSVFEPWCRISILANKVHKNYVVFEDVRHWTFDCIDKR